MRLKDFNCNSFTNDCVGFLTGGSIPDYIKGISVTLCIPLAKHVYSDLPTDFLSTPFGAALRPTIDSMYRRPIPGATPANPSTAAAASNPALANSILQSVASQAHSSYPPPAAPAAATQSLTAPIHLSTNPASFNSLLRTHRAVIAFFTSATCPPCRVIEPVFERLAEEKGGRGAVFTKIDMGVGMGGSVAGEWGVRVTPTFIFFLDGKKVGTHYEFYSTF